MFRLSLSSALVLAFGLALIAIGQARADEPKPQPVALEAKGYLVPVRLVQVSPGVGGQITEVLIKEGQRVKKGEVLVRLDDALLRADLKAAEAEVDASKARLELLMAGAGRTEVDGAKAELNEAQAQLKLAEADWERYQRLGATGAASRQDLDQAKAAVTIGRAKVDRLKVALDARTRGPQPERVAVARAEVKVQEAKRERAAYLLDQATIRAPIDGTVLSRRVELGAYVSPLALNTAGSILDLADLRELEVEVLIPERDLARVSLGQPCTVRTEAYPAVLYKGTVSRISPLVDRAKGAVPVRVRLEVPAKDESLRPDMSAIVRFLAKE